MRRSFLKKINIVIKVSSKGNTWFCVYRLNAKVCCVVWCCSLMPHSRIKFKNSVLEIFARDFIKRRGSGGKWVS